MPEVLKEEDNLQTESSTLDIECEYKYVETDDDGSFEGYASVFNNKDLGNDVIEKGAFAKSIYKKRPKQISEVKKQRVLNYFINTRQMNLLVSLTKSKRTTKV